MRLRRLCEKKATGKCHVDETTRQDYLSGGERREWLEIALLECLKKHGVHRDATKKVRVGLCQKKSLSKKGYIRVFKSKPLQGVNIYISYMYICWRVF